MIPQQASDHLVVLLHGLGRTRHSLARMDRALSRAGFATLRLGYPSTRKPIEDHAAQVSAALQARPIPNNLSFVSHSLGGLVIRQLFAFDAPWRQAVRRIVMLAPPNRGASLAATLDKGGILRSVLGPSFVQIADGVADTLPIPDVPFAIFAGNAAGSRGDGLLTVDETRLAGAAEHHVVRAIHTFIMNHPSVIRGTTTFLSAAAPE